MILGESEMTSTDSVDFLGLSADSHLKFNIHIDKVINGLSFCLFALRKLAQYTNTQVFLTLSYGYFYHNLVYINPVWGSNITSEQITYFVYRRRLSLL